MARRLLDQDRGDELGRRAEAGDYHARRALVRFLANHGRVAEAIELKRPRVEGNERLLYDDERELCGLLAEDCRVEELLRMAAAGSRAARYVLASVLAEQGRVDELRQLAGQVWREFVEDSDAGRRPFLRNQGPPGVRELDEIELLLVLVPLLGGSGRRAKLRNRAAAGDPLARHLYATVVAEKGNADELREMAAAGDLQARYALVALLAEQGQVGELQAMNAAGNSHARHALIAVLTASRHVNELQRMAASGDTQAQHGLETIRTEQAAPDTPPDRHWTDYTYPAPAYSWTPRAFHRPRDSEGAAPDGTVDA